MAKKDSNSDPVFDDTGPPAVVTMSVTPSTTNVSSAVSTAGLLKITILH